MKARSPARSDPRLEKVTEICLQLPEAEVQRHGSHAGFTVRKKTFAYFLNDHHGDGIVGITVKLPPGENASQIQIDPVRFYMPAYIGHRGWVGLRLDVGRVDWSEVGELIRMSYVLVAPKRLAGIVERAARDSGEEWPVRELKKRQ